MYKEGRMTENMNIFTLHWMTNESTTLKIQKKINLVKYHFVRICPGYYNRTFVITLHPNVFF